MPYLQKPVCQRQMGKPVEGFWSEKQGSLKADQQSLVLKWRNPECLLVLHGIIRPKICKDMSLNAVGLSSCWRYICNHWHHLE